MFVVVSCPDFVVDLAWLTISSARDELTMEAAVDLVPTFIVECR